MPTARSTRCQAGRSGGRRSSRHRVCRRDVRSLAHPAAAGHGRRHDPVAGRGTWAARTSCTPDRGRPVARLFVATIGLVRHLRRNADRVDARSRGRRNIEASAGTVTTVSGETARAMSHKGSARSGGPGLRPAGGWSLRTACGTGAAGATAKAAPPDFDDAVIEVTPMGTCFWAIGIARLAKAAASTPLFRTEPPGTRHPTSAARYPPSPTGRHPVPAAFRSCCVARLRAVRRASTRLVTERRGGG